MPEIISVTDMLWQRSGSDDRALIFLADGTSGSAQEWSFFTVFAEAGRWAARLAARGVGRGDRVVLAINPGLDYVAALYGILWLGAVAVPCFPPLRAKELDRFAAVLRDAEPVLVLIDEMYRPRLDELAARGLDACREPLHPGGPAETGGRFEQPTPCVASDLALIQYTSGSTGHPKGVCITHGNLVSNCAALDRSMGHDPGRIGLSWLPPYHDMGLMGTIVLALYHGWPLVLMSPVHFIQQPARWLEAVTDFGVTITVGPNFALELCTTELTDAEVAPLDLSTLTEFYCGAEPIRADTITAFARRFAPCGFDVRALIPCYGMAEATLFIAGKAAGDTWRTGTSADDTAAIVSCGVVDAGHSVRIVDPDTANPLPDGQIGEIWVAGPSVAAGYFRDEPRTGAVFGARIAGADGRYLRTGDLGFLRGDELFVTGRIKDLIIVNARNIYPQDVEFRALQSDPSFRKAAAFAVPGAGTEGLAVVIESQRAALTPRDHTELTERLRAEIIAEFGVAPAVIHIGPRRTVPTTTSGKVRRAATRGLLLTGRLPAFDPTSEGIAV
ncbi:fatty acyl-AMP ligase [Nocardia sp. NPDC050712]|uniref:fatty acyl-AMP ligase n=1 Tax=Nocardia sp. NPDC050712 TaxID=3155518 RepID=UPI00340016FD